MAAFVASFSVRHMCRSTSRSASLRHFTKPGVADAETLRKLRDPLILDVRDPNEVLKGKGGPPALIPGSLNVPLNHNSIGQSERRTTLVEFQEKMGNLGVKLPEDKNAAIVTHCGSGGRGGKARDLLIEAGYTNVHNGGGTSHIAQALNLTEQ